MLTDLVSFNFLYLFPGNVMESGDGNIHVQGLGLHPFLGVFKSFQRLKKKKLNISLSKRMYKLCNINIIDSHFTVSLSFSRFVC